MEETIKSWWLECFKSVRFSLTETPLLLLLTSQWALMSKLFHWFLVWWFLHRPKNAILEFLDGTKNGWRCTDFRLDFFIDIVKKFVISLTSARSYSKASRCVKVFCHLRWKARMTSQTPHAAASRARQNRFLKYFLSFLGEPFTLFLSPPNQKIFRRGKGLKTPLYFNFIEKMGKYF